MADTFARVKHIVGSSAAWAANNIVLGDGEIGVERVSSSDIRIKIGDGTTAWASLAYASSSSTGINSAVQAALDAKVSKAGDTMTGLLVLSGNPSAALGAATKQYVDAINTALTSSINGKLSTSGGTLTGALTLAADPASALQAATKQYVDNADSSKLTKSGDTMTGLLTLSGDPTSALHAATKQYVDGGAYQTVVGGSSTYAGKVVKLNSSGQIDTSVLPSGASYQGTVDMTVAYALTTKPTGSYYTVQTSGSIHSTWTTHLNGSPTTCGAGQFLYQNANGNWDLVGDTTLSTSLSGKLDKSGGTMTGALILAADPTVALGAATKQYADTMLPKAGGTMTGAITLAADPTSALHAATKQYVDAAGSTLTTNYTAADSALSSSLTTSINAKLPLAGGTMTGALTLSGAPTTSLHAATKAYVDTADALAALRANNLSDLANAATARTNLGLGSLATLSAVGTTQITNSNVTYAKIQNVSATARLLGRKTAAAGVVEEVSLSELLDFVGSAAQGDILYRDATGWARLPAGTTGQVLKTNGAGANPSWVNQSGGGLTYLSPVSVSSGSSTYPTVTGIPNTASAVYLFLSPIRTSSAASFVVRIGTSSGMAESGYASVGARNDGSAAQKNVVDGFVVNNNSNLTNMHGIVQLMHVGSNKWLCSYNINGDQMVLNGSGVITLSGALDRVACYASGGFVSTGVLTVAYT